MCKSMHARFSVFALSLSPSLIKAVSVPDWSLVSLPPVGECRHEADLPASTSVFF